MPARSRRVTVLLSEEEHTAWKKAAAEEEVSLSEYVRLAGNERSVGGATRINPTRLKHLITHFQRMLDAIEKPRELGWTGGLLVICVHRFTRALERLPL